MRVDEVLSNFRAALTALVPMAEHAGIGWRRIDGYDEWDAIAGSLFAGLVEEPLRHMLPEAERERFCLPAYDLLVQKYESPAIIEVLLEGDRSFRIFHAFQTEDAPFDTCESRLSEPDSWAVSGEVERHSLECVHFRVCYRAVDGGILRTAGDRDELRSPA